jgi:tRNA A-37 threonylcarbamoyl transferase component Bud32
VIDSGGFGVVCRAYDEKLHRFVALKFHRIQSDVMAEMTTIEARAAARTTCPNIIQIHDVVSERRTRVLVMEWIDGWNLAKFVRKNGPISVPNVAQIAISVCRALDVIHRNQHVHRDIKPGNVMLSRSGEVKVTDFGLANLPEEWFKPTSKTPESDSGLQSIVGTRGYAAPEQIKNAGDVDGRADLYSLAMMIFHLVTGEQPPPSDAAAGHDTAFPSAPSWETRFKQAVASDPSSRRDRRVLEKLVISMASSEPSDRPSTPADVIAQLESIALNADLKQLASQVRNSNGSDGHVRPVLWHRRLAVSAIGLVALFAGWMLVTSLRGLDPLAPNPMAPAEGRKFGHTRKGSIPDADLFGVWRVVDLTEGLVDFPMQLDGRDVSMEVFLNGSLAFLLVDDRLAAWGTTHRKGMPGPNKKKQDQFRWQMKPKGRLLGGAIDLTKGKLLLSLQEDPSEKEMLDSEFKAKPGRVLISMDRHQSLAELRKQVAADGQMITSDLTSNGRDWLMKNVVQGQFRNGVTPQDATHRVNKNRRTGRVVSPAVFGWKQAK